MKILKGGIGCLAALTALAVCAAPSQGVDCFVKCTYSEDQPKGVPPNTAANACIVNTPAKAGIAVPAGPKSTLIPHCAEASLLKGAVLDGLYRSARGLENFRIKHDWRDKPAPLFSTLVPNLKNGRCTGPACAESIDIARVAGVGGKGIDASGSRRVGQPCAIGLPCGAILRPGGALAFQMLPEAPASGRLQLTALRGARGSASVAVVDHRVELPPATLQGGAAYGYALFNEAGTEIAAGEFEVLSAKMQADVEADMADLKRKDPTLDSLAVIAILLDNKLEWDAFQAAR
jgi:hypothetical protein